jgi:hypothetical protein
MARPEGFEPATLTFEEPLHRRRGAREPTRCELMAEEAEAALRAADEGLVGGLLQAQLGDRRGHAWRGRLPRPRGVFRTGDSRHATIARSARSALHLATGLLDPQPLHLLVEVFIAK